MQSNTQVCLYGHEEIEKKILGAWQQNRLHHGLIFVGPKGVGKATCAYRLARALFTNGATAAPAPNTLEVASSNPVFSRVASGAHGDLFVIEPNPDLVLPEISVDRVRLVNRFLSQTPIEAGWRVVLVDGHMNRHASNALLKSLEEPPRRTLMILIAETLGHLSPTLRSRCVHYTFGPVSCAETQKVIEQLYPGTGPQELQGLIALSGGRPGYVSMLKEGGAIALYPKVLETILSLQSQEFEKCIPFCQKYSAKPKKNESIDGLWLVGNLITTIMQRLILLAQGELNAEAYVGERDQLSLLLAWRPVHHWSVIFGQVMEKFEQGRTMYLDRFHILLSALELISTGVQRCVRI